MRRRAKYWCGRCGKFRTHAAKGLCVVCYTTLRRPYVPTGAGRGGAGISRDSRTVAARIEDFGELRRWGLTVEGAAARLGIALRTAWRYEARRKASPENVQPVRQSHDDEYVQQGAA